MIKNFFKRIYNLYTVIMILTVISVFFACRACSVGLINIYRSSLEEKKLSQVSGYASRLSNMLIVTDYLNSTNSTVNSELDIAAELYGGRILVINSTLNVIYDTFDRAIGKTAVISDMVNALEGKNDSEYDWESGYGIYSCGIGATSGGKILGCVYFVYSIADEKAILEKMQTNSAVFTVLVLIISIIVAYMISKLLTASSVKNGENISKIANGNLDTKLEEKGIWEFRSTAAAVNAMLAKVRATEESQQEFVSDVSHELKTPMASMKVLAESLLSQECDDPALYREFLVDINETIDRENKIIQDLLTLVRMDKKSTTLNISLCSMNDIISVVLKRVRPLAEKKNIEVVYESYREISAEVDDSKLIMALTNIAENGIKYNREMGQLRVGLNSDSGYVYINIEDTGIGIPEEAIVHIFDRFYRVDKARARETGGTGLGLAIANDVILMHNGEIKVFSKEFEGTTFNIRIPLFYRKEHIKVIDDPVR